MWRRPAVPLGNRRETKSLGSREAVALLDSPSSSQFRRFKAQGARIGSGNRRSLIVLEVCDGDLRGHIAFH